VPIELRAPAARAFRLTWNVGEDGVRLARPAPFEPGRPVAVRLRLPDAPDVLSLRAELRPDGSDDGDRAADEEHAIELVFLDPPEEARAALRRYVHQRLGLP
jgi:hypothetical protein